MNKFRGMYLFTRLIDLGSFAAVGSEQGTSASMISKELQKLEKDIGARLVHRTTRSIQLTQIGEGYLRRCRKILAHVDEADSFVSRAQNSMQGALRINLPMVLGMTDLMRVMSDFMLEYPQIKLDIHLGDENLDLVEHGFDLGFRASSRPVDTHYVGKKLTEFTYHVCAAESYLTTHSPITTPADLKDHNCFIYSYFKGNNVWPLQGGIKVDGNLRVNNTLFMREAIERGLGIGFLPGFVALPALERGTIVEILKNIQKPALNVYALYPNRKYAPPILTTCIAFIEAWFKRK